MKGSILVIGAGPGDPKLLTAAAGEALKSADVVFAPGRLSGLWPGSVVYESVKDVCERLRGESDAGRRAAVLVSGDPGLYSLCTLLRETLGTDRLTVVPGISALQAFSAAVGQPWQEAALLSGHGRPLTVSRLGHEVRTHHRTFLLCDALRSPAWAAKALMLEGLEGAEMWVGEALTTPEQRLTRGTPSEMQGYSAEGLAMVLILNADPASGLPPVGLPDEAFVRGAIPMTKRPVRIQALAALRLPPDAVVWDIGAGTGSVSIECARQCPMGRVYAIEEKEEGAALIRENARRLCVNNLEVVPGHAPEALACLPVPTHVFIGGHGDALLPIVQALSALDSPIRAAATAVSLEGIAELRECFSWEAFSQVEIMQMAFSPAKAVGHVHLFQALNPVTLFSGILGGDAP